MSNKGSAYERQFCKQLSEWWTAGLGLEPRTDVFWRTAASGGRATIRARSGRTTCNQYGDICALDPTGQPILNLMTMELKCGYGQYTTSHLSDLLDKPNSSARTLWEKWICQARHSASLSGTDWWLIVHKRSRREEIAVFPFHMTEELDRHRCTNKTRFRPMIYMKAEVRDEVTPYPNEMPVNIIAVCLDQFLAWLNPKRIAEVYYDKKER